MQALHRLREVIAEQLKALSPSSRLLIGCLAIIVVMGLFIVGLYTGRSELVPLPVPLTAQTRGAVTSYLNQRGVEWTDRGDQILVPLEQRHVVLAQLTDQEIISPDQINFDALVQQESPFLSKAQNDRRWLVATMNHLARTISRMNGVNRADVVIDEPSRPGGIGAARLRPSASVTVSSRQGLSQEQVNAIAAMVAGAHAELRIADVAVVDGVAGRVRRATEEESAAAGLYLDLQQKHTRHYEQKLQKALDYIPEVNVAVNVIVDHREVIEQSRMVDDPKQAVESESSRTISSTRGSASGEPGVRPNTGVRLGSGGRTSSHSDERSDTTLSAAFGGTDRNSRDPGGYALQINASIGVPRSYFIRMFREQGGDAAAEPTAQELDAIVQVEIPRIQTQVQPLIDTGPKAGVVEGTVAVSMIPDFVAAGIGDAAEGGAAGAGAGLLDESLVKYVSLGGLALLSIGMMLMMVRKATVRPALPTDDELEGAAPPLPGVREQIVGEAESRDVPMEGVELDESEIRRHQMLTQLNELSATHTADAAKILGRWIREQPA